VLRYKKTSLYRAGYPCHARLILSPFGTAPIRRAFRSTEHSLHDCGGGGNLLCDRYSYKI